MKRNRRNFLRRIALGTGALATGLPTLANAKVIEDHKMTEAAIDYGSQQFNMCGYAAPKIDNVRIAVIGLGMRGGGAIERLSYIEGAQVTVLCDKYSDRVDAAQKILEKMGRPKAKGYSGEHGWKELVVNADVDLVYNVTPWHLHAPISIAAMKNGKHAVSEVNAGLTIDELWSLIETSEKTKKHCMMLENCCYDFFELLTLNIARNGLFGELLHAEGAYIHDLTRDYLFNKNAYADMWRLKQNYQLQGNLYPTHGLGPIAQCLNINRGDKMDYLTSMSSSDFTLNNLAKETSATDSFFTEYVDKSYHGNMNTTLIRTNKGKTIMLQHDVSSPRPYSRIHLLSGTKGMAQKWPGPEHIAFGHSWIKEDQLKELYEKYSPPILKHIGNIAKDVGGHGGMDFIMDWRLIDCLRNGLPLDQDVYDAAAWSSIIPLTDRSVKGKSKIIDIPDFTRGAWKVNKPVDLTLNGGGNTNVRQKVKNTIM